MLAGERMFIPCLARTLTRARSAGCARGCGRLGVYIRRAVTARRRKFWGVMGGWRLKQGWVEGEWRGSCTTFVRLLVDGRWDIAGDDDMVMVGSGVVGVELGCGVGVYVMGNGLN